MIPTQYFKNVRRIAECFITITNDDRSQKNNFNQSGKDLIDYNWKIMNAPLNIKGITEAWKSKEAIDAIPELNEVPCDKLEFWASNLNRAFDTLLLTFKGQLERCRDNKVYLRSDLQEFDPDKNMTASNASIEWDHEKEKPEEEAHIVFPTATRKSEVGIPDEVNGDLPAEAGHLKNITEAKDGDQIKEYLKNF